MKLTGLFLELSIITLMVVYTNKIVNIKQHNPKPGVNAELKPYVDRFYSVVETHCGHQIRRPELNIDIGDAQFDFTRSIAGWCTRTKPLNIMISKKTFEFSTEAEKEQLVFHELGHCVLNKEHNEKLDDSGTPVSIMHPETLTDPMYRSKYKQYMQEFLEGIDCKSLK